MSLIRLQGISMRYSGPLLLDRVELSLEPQERVALVGRNGEGKSTLLRIVAGLEAPDAGERILQPGVRVGSLPQVVPRDLKGPAIDIVQAGADPSLEEWDAHQRSTNILERMGLAADAPFEQLSGGRQRRVLLARALVQDLSLIHI